MVKGELSKEAMELVSGLFFFLFADIKYQITVMKCGLLQHFTDQWKLIQVKRVIKLFSMFVREVWSCMRIGR